jgi:hypothetical protein
MALPWSPLMLVLPPHPALFLGFHLDAQIFLRPLSDVTVILDVCLDHSIEDLGTPADLQVLTYSSKGLVLGSLAVKGIEAEGTLNLSGRLRGGPALPPSSLH